MKFLKTGKYLIAFALLFAIAATAVSVVATSDDTAVPPDNTSAAVVEKEDSTTSNITVNMGEDGKTYVELDKVNVKFNMDTEMTLENAMIAVAERAKEIVNTVDVIKVRKNEDVWTEQVYNISENISLKADIVSVMCLSTFRSEYNRPVVYETEDEYYRLDLKSHPEYSEKAQYLAFVYLLAKTYPEDILIMESLYERPENCRRPCFGMVFCFDYKGKGYDTVEAYGKALRNGEAAMSENAYIIDPEIQHIAKCSIQHFFAPGISRYESDQNLFDEFFTK